MGGVTAPPIL